MSLWGVIWNFSAPNVITAIQFGAENGQNENELFELEKIKNAFQRKKATINVGGNGFSVKNHKLCEGYWQCQIDIGSINLSDVRSIK